MKFVGGLVAGAGVVLLGAVAIGYPEIDRKPAAADTPNMAEVGQPREVEQGVAQFLAQPKLPEPPLPPVAEELPLPAPEQSAQTQQATKQEVAQVPEATPEETQTDVRLTAAHSEAANAWRELQLFDAPTKPETGQAEEPVQAAEDAQALDELTAAVPAEQQPPQPIELRPDSAEFSLADADAPTTEQAIAWKPFHSQVSAAGFARRLSTQLGFPFRAVRAGPAKYQVVFDYTDAAQRELLESQITSITGYTP